MNNKYKKWMKIAGLILLPTPITVLVLIGWGIKKMRKDKTGTDSKVISKNQEDDK